MTGHLVSGQSPLWVPLLDCWCDRAWAQQEEEAGVLSHVALSFVPVAL